MPANITFRTVNAHHELACLLSRRAEGLRLGQWDSTLLTAKQLKRLGTDDQLQKRLAQLMAQQCFRNTELENLHAGTVPDSITEDYTDVKVVTPHGEIAWSELSRPNDEEMKILMIEVVNKTCTFLSMLFASGPKTLEPILEGLQKLDMVPHWNDPEIMSL